MKTMHAAQITSTLEDPARSSRLYAFIQSGDRQLWK
jgi:hypothetical protein